MLGPPRHSLFALPHSSTQTARRTRPTFLPCPIQNTWIILVSRIVPGSLLSNDSALSGLLLWALATRVAAWPVAYASSSSYCIVGSPNPHGNCFYRRFARNHHVCNRRYIHFHARGVRFETALDFPESQSTQNQRHFL